MAQNKSASFFNMFKGLNIKHFCTIMGNIFALINIYMFMSVCQREGTLGDDDSADMDGESGRGFEEYEWAGQKRIRATALLEGGFRGINKHQNKSLVLFHDSSLLR